MHQQMSALRHDIAALRTELNRVREQTPFVPPPDAPDPRAQTQTQIEAGRWRSKPGRVSAVRRRPGADYKARRCDCMANRPSKISESINSCSIVSQGATFQAAPPVINVTGASPQRALRWRCRRSIAPVMA